MRTLSRFLAAALVVLLARSFAYALTPSPMARALERGAGGPRLPVLTLAALTLGSALAIAICWLAAFGVRERALLERRPLAVPAPRFSPARTLALALVLSAGSSIAGGLLEAYLHWRAGLGWHGLQCVFGPVHRDLLPIATALSLVAAAVIAAAEHVAAWMRRTLALLRTVTPHLFGLRASVLEAVAAPRPQRQPAHSRPRAPPAFS